MDDEEKHTPKINGGPLTDEGRLTWKTHEEEEQEVSF